MVVVKHIQHNKRRKHNKQTQGKHDNIIISLVKNMTIKLLSILK